MTKKDLKNGMIVEAREGTRYLCCDEVIRGLNEWNVMSNYTDNLNNTKFRQLDIVKVYEDTGMYNLNTIFKHDYLKLIWQRPETPKLSEKEIEILKALDVIGFTHIARDRNSNIYAYYSELKKPCNFSSLANGSLYFEIKTGLFAFIMFADEKTTSIQELLSDFEKGEKND